MNKKLFLSEVRGGDYAHPGGKDAIDIVMSKFSKDPQKRILDVGSGLGYTAKYIWEQGFGKVTGIDINSKCIEYANQNYPEVRFVHSDVDYCDSEFFPNSFDLVILFSSFYAFDDQKHSLKVLNKVAKPGASLVIFEYLALKGYNMLNPFASDGTLFTPVYADEIEKLLKGAGWQLDELVELNEEYREWYRVLLEKIETKKDTLIEKYGKGLYNEMYDNFHELNQALVKNILGGCIVFAHKV